MHAELSVAAQNMKKLTQLILLDPTAIRAIITRCSKEGQRLSIQADSVALNLTATSLIASMHLLNTYLKAVRLGKKESHDRYEEERLALVNVTGVRIW